MMSLTCSFSIARVAPNALQAIHINIYRKIDTITRKPPVLPKGAMTMAGTTESMAAQDTAQLIAMAGTRCIQLSTTRAGSPCNGAAQAHAERHDALAP